MPIDPRVISSPGDIEGIAVALGDLKRRMAAMEAVRTVIGPGSVDGTTLAANSITGAQIAPASIVTGNIQAGAIITSLIAANAVTANEIAAGSINAGHMSANSISSGSIQAGAVTTTALAAGAVVAGKVAANAITATEIAAGAVTAAKILSDTITATQIAADAITTSELAANAVTTTELAANSVTANSIAANAVTATAIISDTAMADKILNRVQNSTSITTSGLAAVTANLGTITAGTITGATVQTAASGARVVLNTGGLTVYNAAGTAVMTATGGNITMTGTVTANAASVLPAVAVTGQIATGQIANDAVTGPKIPQDAIVATHIDGNSITAIDLDALSARVGKLAVNSVDALSVQATSIDATKMNVSSLSAITANMGTLTSGTITGALIQTASTGPRVLLDGANNKFSIHDGTTADVIKIDGTSGVSIGSSSAVLGATGVRVVSWNDASAGQILSMWGSKPFGSGVQAFTVAQQPRTESAGAIMTVGALPTPISPGQADGHFGSRLTFQSSLYNDSSGRIDVVVAGSTAQYTKKLLDATGASDFPLPYSASVTSLSTTNLTGAFSDPATGTNGPEITNVIIPTGGRFIEISAECEAKHSAANTNGIWFVILFSKDGAAYTYAPPAGYTSNPAYMDTSSVDVSFGADMFFADTTFRPLRMGQARTPMGNGTSSYLFPSATRLWIPAGTWKFKMAYGIHSGGSGTASYQNRRLHVLVLGA